MKAVICTKSGAPEVLQIKEIANPRPKDDEVLIKIYASTVTRGDVILRKLPSFLWWPLQIFFGFKRKKIPGHELAGVIEKVGNEVTKFKSGDKVFGTTSFLSVGSNAEYVCLPAERKKGVLELMPVNVTFAEAAAVPVGAMSALYILQKGNIQKGQKVLIYGASGSVGTFAVQIARHYGAEVTGVCSSANLDLVASIGASQVIDYTKEDFTQIPDTYDLIFDAVRKISESKVKKLLKKNGVFLTIQSTTRERKEDLMYLKTLIEAGKIKSVIDKIYPMENIVEAHRYVDLGHKKGNVVIKNLDYEEKIR